MKLPLWYWLVAGLMLWAASLALLVLGHDTIGVILGSLALAHMYGFGFLCGVKMLAQEARREARRWQREQSRRSGRCP